MRRIKHIPLKRLCRIAIRWIVVLSVGSILFFMTLRFVVEVKIVPSESMLHTIEVGDYVLVNKLAYGAPIPSDIAQVPLLNMLSYFPEIRNAWSKWALHTQRLPGYTTICRGDIAVYESPINSELKLIKRVIALPGDTLQIVNGKVYINKLLQPNPKGAILIDSTAETPRVPFPEGTKWTLNNYGPLTIPPDSFFMMGDYRGNSQDSRFYGFVPRSLFIGRGTVLSFFRRFWNKNDNE